MSNQPTDQASSNARGAEFIGLALLFIAFWGEPDLVDAAITYLSTAAEVTCNG